MTFKCWLMGCAFTADPYDAHFEPFCKRCRLEAGDEGTCEAPLWTRVGWRLKYRWTRLWWRVRRPCICGRRFIWFSGNRGSCGSDCIPF